MQTQKPIKFAKFMFLFLATYCVFAAAFVGLAGQFLSLAFRSLLMPFVMILGCGLVLSLLIYWVRQSYEQRKSVATRFALAIFFYLQLFAFVVGFGAARVGIVSWSTMLHDYVPLLVPGAAISSVVVYSSTRRRLKAVEKE
jgi:asparagine N-glycosylation enzyme membrane subunit Stt3